MAVDISSLTPAERRVAGQLKYRPLKNHKEIGRTLGIATQTVGKHACSIYRALGVEGQAELAELLHDVHISSYDYEKPCGCGTGCGKMILVPQRKAGRAPVYHPDCAQAKRAADVKRYATQRYRAAKAREKAEKAAARAEEMA